MLEFQNMSIYRQEKRILEDFSLQVPDGAIMGLIGSDNRAKSMLLAAAGGSQAPDFGRIVLDGVPVHLEREKSFMRFGYMPGEYGFYDLLRVDEYFDLFLSLYRVNGRYRQKRMEEVAELFGIRQYMSAFIMDLPQDVLPFLCLAKTMLHDPEWLLLDNPLAGLNGAKRNAMIKILLILQETGKSILINTPMFLETRDFFTHLAMIDDGRLVSVGTTDEIYETALKRSPVRMRVLAGLDQALEVLRDNGLVDRVTVDEKDIIFRFNGAEREEAELLSDLVAAGALIQNYMRDRVDIEETFRR